MLDEERKRRENELKALEAYLADEVAFSLAKRRKSSTDQSAGRGRKPPAAN